MFGPSNLFDITKGIKLSLKIHERTLAIENNLFIRVLIDLDLAGALPERILVKRRQLNFFVGIKYEKSLELCVNCHTIGHVVEDFWRESGGRYQGVVNNQQRRDTNQNVTRGERRTAPTWNNQEHNAKRQLQETQFLIVVWKGMMLGYIDNQIRMKSERTERRFIRTGSMNHSYRLKGS